jgi:hypothetical protein
MLCRFAGEGDRGYGDAVDSSGLSAHLDVCHAGYDEWRADDN